jgi:hypothetical protein
MAATLFRELTPQQRALVALAVLLDGRDAAEFLSQDIQLGEHFRAVIEQLTRDDLEMRIPFMGTLYREAIADLGRE